MKKLQNTTDISMEQSKSNTGTNVEQKDNSNYFERKEINNTPFTLIKNEEQYSIVLGNHRLSDIHTSEKEAMQYMETWNFKTNVIAAMIEITLTLKEEVKQLTEENKQYAN